MKSSLHPRWARRTATALLALAVLVTTLLSGVSATPARATGTPVLGAYTGELLLPAGSDKVRHIDIPGTISKLSYANVNTFAYLIYPYGLANTDYGSTRGQTGKLTSQAQWNDLPAFLTAAAAAGINVWVYLVPPSESSAGYSTSVYAPFYWDYVKWGDEIGKLAATHPNLKAIAMDDFGGNAVASSPWSFKFTPTNVAQIRQAARAHAPWVTFLPVLYYCQVHGNGTFVSTYRTIVDGFIPVYNGSPSCTWWSGDGTPVPNTTDASLANLHYRVESSMMKCQSGGCMELGVPWSTPTSAGAWGSIHQNVTVTSTGTKTLSFWVNDDWIGGYPGGYHMLQVLVDGQVVWQEDASTWKDWHKVSLDLTNALAGKSTAQLRLRLYEAAGVSNWHISAWFDSLQATGFTLNNPGFDTSYSGWTGQESHALFEHRWVPSMLVYPIGYAHNIPEDNGAVTTSAYTTSVVNTALTLVSEGKADGVFVYAMNLTGQPNGYADPATINSIRAIYGTF